jgi:hypothetical protein
MNSVNLHTVCYELVNRVQRLNKYIILCNDWLATGKLSH